MQAHAGGHACRLFMHTPSSSLAGKRIIIVVVIIIIFIIIFISIIIIIIIIIMMNAIHSTHGLQTKMKHTLVEGCELVEGASNGAAHGGLPRSLGGQCRQVA